MRIVKDPFLQFLALGALIFVVYSFSKSAERTDAEKRIAIDGPTQDWIYSNFEKQFRRRPSRLEMGSLIEAFIEHEVKYREALAMGLDERDTIVRRRMMQKFDFLFGNAAADVVPEDGVLQDWYATHTDEFAIPATVSFKHVWFSPDNRGNDAAADAAEAREALRAGEERPGDRFPFAVVFDTANRAEVRNVMGPEFTQKVFEAPINEWSGPFESGLGHHVVRVTQKSRRESRPFEEVRDAVLQRWRDLESDLIQAELVARLIAGYDIVIDEAAIVQFDYAPDPESDTP